MAVSKEEFKEKMRETLAKSFDLASTKFFIFGSQANLAEFRKSDVDLGIETQEEIDFSKLMKLKSDLEEANPTLLPIDLVDFATVKPEFRKIALKNIEEI